MTCYMGGKGNELRRDTVGSGFHKQQQCPRKKITAVSHALFLLNRFPS